MNETRNYDGTKVGVPFVRVNDLRNFYPTRGVSKVQYHEQEAVLMADGTVRELSDLGWVDMEVAATDTTPAPIVHPVTGQALPQSTTPQQVMLGILAILRQNQHKNDQAAAAAAAAAAVAQAGEAS